MLFVICLTAVKRLCVFYFHYSSTVFALLTLRVYYNILSANFLCVFVWFIWLRVCASFHYILCFHCLICSILRFSWLEVLRFRHWAQFICRLGFVLLRFELAVSFSDVHTRDCCYHRLHVDRCVGILGTDVHSPYNLSSMFGERVLWRFICIKVVGRTRLLNLLLIKCSNCAVACTISA